MLTLWAQFYWQFCEPHKCNITWYIVFWFAKAKPQAKWWCFLFYFLVTNLITQKVPSFLPSTSLKIGGYCISRAIFSKIVNRRLGIEIFLEKAWHMCSETTKKCMDIWDMHSLQGEGRAIGRKKSEQAWTGSEPSQCHCLEMRRGHVSSLVFHSNL
jgi:hypothetical protein